MKNYHAGIFLIIGIMLLYFGYSGSSALQVELSQFLDGNSSDQSVWMIITGAAAVIMGLTGLLRGDSSNRQK